MRSIPTDASFDADVFTPYIDGDGNYVHPEGVLAPPAGFEFVRIGRPQPGEKYVSRALAVGVLRDPDRFPSFTPWDVPSHASSHGYLPDNIVVQVAPEKPAPLAVIEITSQTRLTVLGKPLTLKQAVSLREELDNYIAANEVLDLLNQSLALDAAASGNTVEYADDLS